MKSLAMESIRNVGPGGHFLGQKHTREHMRTSLVRGVTHQLDEQNKYRDPHEVARETRRVGSSKTINPNHSKQANKPNLPASLPPLIRN